MIIYTNSVYSHNIILLLVATDQIPTDLAPLTLLSHHGVHFSEVELAKTHEFEAQEAQEISKYIPTCTSKQAVLNLCCLAIIMFIIIFQ